MKYDLAKMNPDQVNQVIDSEIMGNKKGKTCHGPLTVFVEVRNTNQQPMRWRCEECGGAWTYEVGQKCPVGFESGHWRIAPDYFGSQKRAMEILEHVAKQGKPLQEAMDYHLFQVTYNHKGMPEMKTGLSVVQRVVALNAEKVAFACIHALNALDTMEDIALERMRNGSGRNGR